MQVKFYVCTQEAYDALQTPDNGTFYFAVEDTSVLNAGGNFYLGANLIGNGLTIEAVIQYFQDNELTFENLTAGNITPKTDDLFEDLALISIRTTGGDVDLKSGESELRTIRGNLKEATSTVGGVTGTVYTPFNPATYVSTDMNLIDTNQVYTSSGHYYYYFPVYKGTAGAHGTTQQNNGYVVVNGTPAAVKFRTTKPASASDCLGATSITPWYTTGVNYYATDSDGWLILDFTSEISTTGDNAVGCHVAWSGYMDSTPGTTTNKSVKDIESTVQAIHTWGMAALYGDDRSVFDEIDLDGQKRYTRTDRLLVSGLSWGYQTVTENETTKYIYTADVTGMLPDGLYVIDNTGIEFTLSGTTLSFTSDSIIDWTGSDYTNKYIYFEKETVTEASVTLTKDNYSCDFGLTYFLLASGEITDVKGWIREAYQQSGKDQIFNNITYTKTMAEVVATALCELDERLKPIENGFDEGFQYIKVADLEVTGDVTIAGNLTVTGTTNINPSWIEI